jgi:hypothetical protein
MKFINYIEKISGVDVYGMSSFLTFFIIMTIWALKADKKLIKELSEMPLNND